MLSRRIAIGYGAAWFDQVLRSLESVRFDRVGVRGHGALCFWRSQLLAGRRRLGIRNDGAGFAVSGLINPLWFRRRIVGYRARHAFGLTPLRRA
jgi:hypothetical protein